jgi:hypothetical protein
MNAIKADEINAMFFTSISSTFAPESILSIFRASATNPSSGLLSTMRALCLCPCLSFSPQRLSSGRLTPLLLEVKTGELEKAATVGRKCHGSTSTLNTTRSTAVGKICRRLQCSIADDWLWPVLDVSGGGKPWM